MKKNLFLVVLASLLAIMSASCQKEKLDNSFSSETAMTSVRTVKYTVDGANGLIVLYGETEWRDFLDRMMTLTAQGADVSFYIEELYCDCGAKETETKNTKDKKEAEEWSQDKAEDGYQVVVTYNSSNGEYNCVAHK